jgi:hypothetical protein
MVPNSTTGNNQPNNSDSIQYEAIRRQHATATINQTSARMHGARWSMATAHGHHFWMELELKFLQRMERHASGFNSIESKAIRWQHVGSNNTTINQMTARRLSAAWSAMVNGNGKGNGPGRQFRDGIKRHSFRFQM